MAITIRNRDTEAMIRRIGKRRNEGPSATIRRLAQKEIAQMSRVSPEERQRRMKAWDELMALAPPRDPNVKWEDLAREMDELFDYLEEDEAEGRS